MAANADHPTSHPTPHPPTTSPTPAAPQAQPAPPRNDPLVQYVLVRGDLTKDPLNWPGGSVMAQGVHAAVAAVWRYREDARTEEYAGQEGGVGTGTGNAGGAASEAGQMHTVVLEAKGEGAVLKTAAAMEADGVKFVVWTEMPEGMVTALATKPYRRSEVQRYFKKHRLFG